VVAYDGLTLTRTAHNDDDTGGVRDEIGGSDDIVTGCQVRDINMGFQETCVLDRIKICVVPTSR